MIQRKQTLFLLFSIIFMIGYIFSPVVRVDGGSIASFSLYPYSMHFSKNVNFPIIGHYFVLLCLVSAGIAIGINLLTILLFRFRKVQVAFCWLAILPLLYTFCYVYYRWSSGESIQDQYFYFGNLLPLFSIVFTFIAMFYIRKDEELVKSVDRLR